VHFRALPAVFSHPEDRNGGKKIAPGRFFFAPPPFGFFRFPSFVPAFFYEVAIRAGGGGEKRGPNRLKMCEFNHLR
jgi:hypothetical protein